MSRYPYRFQAETDPRDARIKRLEDELLEARRLVVDMTPDPFPKLLMGYYHCENREAGTRWARELAEKIVELAKPVEGTWNASAFCPLCGDGSSSPYTQGYTLPEGLRRHLAGWGNTSKCQVMEIVNAMAIERFNEKFAAAEAAVEKAEQDRRKERFATEQLYLIDPNVPPILIDEGMYSWDCLRTADGEGSDGIRWAEERLVGMGFQKVMDGRTLSYVKRHQNAKGEFVAYADPRAGREIRVRVLALTPKGNPSKKQTTQIAVRDSWKNDLPAKLAKLINQGTGAA